MFQCFHTPLEVATVAILLGRPQPFDHYWRTGSATGPRIFDQTGLPRDGIFLPTFMGIEEYLFTKWALGGIAGYSPRAFIRTTTRVSSRKGYSGPIDIQVFMLNKPAEWYVPPLQS